MREGEERERHYEKRDTFDCLKKIDYKKKKIELFLEI